MAYSNSPFAWAVVGIVCAATIGYFVKSELDLKKLKNEGELVEGKLIGYELTGGWVNNHPMVKFHIQIDNEEPIMFKQVLPQFYLSKLNIDNTYKFRRDKKDRTNIIFEEDFFTQGTMN